jgi:hypothetical protein
MQTNMFKPADCKEVDMEKLIVIEFRQRELSDFKDLCESGIRDARKQGNADELNRYKTLFLQVREQQNY